MKKFDPAKLKLIGSFFVLVFLFASIAVITRYLPAQRGTQPRAATTVTLLPSGPGSSSVDEVVPVGCSQKWQCVDDDPTSDGDTSYVRACWGEYSPGNFAFCREFYDLASSNIQNGSTINSISVYISVKGGTTSHTPYVCPFVQTSGISWSGTKKGTCEPISTGSYTTLSSLANLTCNPVRAGCPAWSLEDVNNLQVGWDADSYSRLTRAWAVVSYTPPSCTNECSQGAKQCVSSTQYQTCGYDGSCWKWSSAISCLAGQTCSGGSCITPAVPKPTVSISANPSSITSGQSSTLSWSCTPNDGTVSVSISASTPPNIGVVSCTGNKTVTPTSSITYTAVASSPGGGTSNPAYASITVDGKPPPKPPGPKPPGLGPSGKLETLQLQVSVPYLVGKMKIPVVIGSLSKEIEVSPDTKEYSLDVKEANISIGSPLIVVVGGNKTLLKKVEGKAEAVSQTIQTGDLILGDVLANNIIDSSDELAALNAISKGLLQGDLNADGVTNSIDWAIILINFGKKGDT